MWSSTENPNFASSLTWDKNFYICASATSWISDCFSGIDYIQRDFCHLATPTACNIFNLFLCSHAL